MDRDQKHCLCPCKFADLRFADWDAKDICRFVSCELIITNMLILDLGTGTPPKFADLPIAEEAQEFADLRIAD